MQCRELPVTTGTQHREPPASFIATPSFPKKESSAMPHRATGDAASSHPRRCIEPLVKAVMQHRGLSRECCIGARGSHRRALHCSSAVGDFQHRVATTSVASQRSRGYIAMRWLWSSCCITAQRTWTRSCVAAPAVVDEHHFESPTSPPGSPQLWWCLPCLPFMDDALQLCPLQRCSGGAPAAGARRPAANPSDFPAAMVVLAMARSPLAMRWKGKEERNVWRSNFVERR